MARKKPTKRPPGSTTKRKRVSTGGRAKRAGKSKKKSAKKKASKTQRAKKKGKTPVRQTAGGGKRKPPSRRSGGAARDKGRRKKGAKKPARLPRRRRVAKRHNTWRDPKTGHFATPKSPGAWDYSKGKPPRAAPKGPLKKKPKKLPPLQPARPAPRKLPPATLAEPTITMIPPSATAREAIRGFEELIHEMIFRLGLGLGQFRQRVVLNRDGTVDAMLVLTEIPRNVGLANILRDMQLAILPVPGARMLVEFQLGARDEDELEDLEERYLRTRTRRKGGAPFKVDTAYFTAERWKRDMFVNAQQLLDALRNRGRSVRGIVLRSYWDKKDKWRPRPALDNRKRGGFKHRKPSRAKPRPAKRRPTKSRPTKLRKTRKRK